ncbi:MAG TPA: hypothetical protein VGL20_01395 [Candidatus Dormibacteraeota bacterium]|jgi:hypothetical protein
MTTRHRLTAAAAVAGALAIAVPAVHASAATTPPVGGLQVGANASPSDGRIDANAGLDSLQAALGLTQDAWRIGAADGLAGMKAGATAGLQGWQAGATAGLAGMQAGVSALQDFFPIGGGTHLVPQHR